MRPLKDSTTRRNAGLTMHAERSSTSGFESHSVTASAINRHRHERTDSVEDTLCRSVQRSNRFIGLPATVRVAQSIQIPDTINARRSAKTSFHGTSFALRSTASWGIGKAHHWIEGSSHSLTGVFFALKQNGAEKSAGLSKHLTIWERRNSIVSFAGRITLRTQPIKGHDERRMLQRFSFRLRHL